MTDDLLDRAQNYWFNECEAGRRVHDMDVGDLAGFARAALEAATS